MLGCLLKERLRQHSSTQPTKKKICTYNQQPALRSNILKPTSMKTLLLTALILTSTLIPAAHSNPNPTTPKLAQADLSEGLLTPQQVQQTAKDITVRITSATNGGSGVIIAKKGSTYLILTNAHVIKRATKIEIQAPDGQKYTATAIDGGFNSKSDLALLQFTSNTKYTLANLSNVVGSAIEAERTIYSAGFPFDSKDIRITSGEISQLSDLPFDDGTQIGYVTNKGEKGIRQGMSGGAIFDARGNLLGINTIGIAPILPNYTYQDGSKPIPKLAAKYTRANWGIPIYNFLTSVKADVLYGYDNLPKLERQVIPTGYLAKLNTKVRQMTVRIEAGTGNGSGTIIAREGNTYYVLTAKHVLQNPETNQKYSNPQIITYDQDRHSLTSYIVAENLDMAVIKFSSTSNYPIARLNEYQPNNDNLVFVGGFPDRKDINSPLWQWQLNPGFILSPESGKLVTQSNLSFSNGYDLYYGSVSYGGMSGGPVLDTDGNIIGIHGRAEASDTAILGGSLGISIQSFTGLLGKFQVKPGLLNITKNSPQTLNGRDRQTVLTATNSIPQPEAGAVGSRWLAYGNQLTRTLQFDKAVVAFDKAISQGEVFQGNYGKTLSLLILREYDAARISIAKAIKLVPNNKSRANYYYLWKYQSRIFARLGNYRDAIESIDIAIGLEPKDMMLRQEKVAILIENKQYPQAIAICNEMIRIDRAAYIYNTRATAKFQSGDLKGAIGDANQAININPKYSEAYLNRSLIGSTLGDFKSAISDADRAININPNFAEGYLMRSLVNIQVSNFKGAASDSTKAISINNTKGGFYQSIASNRNGISILALTLRGQANLKLENFKDAIADSSRTIELINATTGNRQLITALPVAFLLRGIAKASLEDMNGGIIDITNAAKLAREQGQTQLYQETIGVLNILTPLANYDRAIALAPKNASLYVERGNFKNEKMKNANAALADYNQAIAIDPKYAIAYAVRAIIKSQNLNDPRGAMVDLNKSIELDSKFIDGYYNRADLNYFLGNKTAALTDFQKVLALDKNAMVGSISQGIIYLEQELIPQAIASFNRSVKISSDTPDIYKYRGLAYLRQGNKTAAIQDWRKAATGYQQLHTLKDYELVRGWLKKLGVTE
jgi:tetratricopeptide (TPR) repeat protein/S1-C subfamily serine protease